MLLTPQHRRSARVAARMQKTVQQDFNERVANGTMTKQELLNAPTCLRSFDEAEDAILAQSDEESEEEEDEFLQAWKEGRAAAIASQQKAEEEDEPTRKTRLFLEGCVLTEDPLVLKLIVSKLPAPLVSAIIQQLIKELEEAQQEEEKEEEEEEQEEEEQEEEEQEEDSIASRLLKRRRMGRTRGQH